MMLTNIQQATIYLLAKTSAINACVLAKTSAFNKCEEFRDELRENFNSRAQMRRTKRLLYLDETDERQIMSMQVQQRPILPQLITTAPFLWHGRFAKLQNRLRLQIILRTHQSL